MARTFLQQETQIRNTPAVDYDDSIAASLANFETNPTNLMEDLNNLRSQAHNLLKNMAGNWYDDLNTPAALDAGAQRGVNDLNTDLHELERKRVLVQVTVTPDVVVPTKAKATNNLLLNSNASNGDTVTTGTKTYTFQTVLTNVDGNVLIGATASDSLDNLIAAITLGAGSGVVYAAATTANGFVTAVAGAGDSMDVTALVFGTYGNTIATTEALTDPLSGWTSATCLGGAGDIKILGVGQIPTGSGATGAVGAVTTRGAVVAYVASFGNRSLNEVAGSNAISPKDLCIIIDSVTHDPILSGGREVYGLLQSEFSVDGTTITTSTPNRVMLTFVRPDSLGDDLEFCPVDDIEGKSIHYAYVERKALDDLNEQDFLKGAIVDVGTTTVDRQSAYNNQGVVPVDVTTHSTLDLEGAGLYWRIRDDLEAELFKITEGSAGGTTRIAFGPDVDFFDVDAVDNDFLNGIKVDTGAAGTTINVGVTANRIDAGGELTIKSGSSGGAQDVNLVADDELNLTDQWRAGSTWGLADGIALANASAEWSLFETNFGEVSLLNAINQAYASAAGLNRGTKTYATVSGGPHVAGTSISLADGNLDVALPDMSLGSFLAHDVFVNGALLRPEAAYPGANDYGPGATLSPAKLKFEFKMHTGDVLCVVPWNP